MMSSCTAVSVASHLPLVHKVAKRIARRLPRVVELGDLVAAGTIGLIDAAKRFDPKRAQSFDGYAQLRVRGAIFDHLREMDWLSRSQRARVNGDDAAVLGVVSVEDVRDDGFDGFAHDLPSPALAFDVRERNEKLGDAVAQLPKRSQEILALYYVEDLTLREIGVVFGITESRACQLHGQALAQLRAQLV
jgi:RNA polymerase sigma factor for flagellar operon FliA